MNSAASKRAAFSQSLGSEGELSQKSDSKRNSRFEPTVSKASACPRLLVIHGNSRAKLLRLSLEKRHRIMSILIKVYFGKTGCVQAICASELVMRART